MSYTTRLITPPLEREEIYPYRRVWRSILLEAIITTATMTLFFLIFGLFGLQLPAAIQPVINLILALFPAFLWLIFSYLQEQRVAEPRSQMGVVFILTLLMANAIGLPLIETFFQPQVWLSTESTLNRIVGYSVTIGIVQEFIKYIVLRYTVWASFRNRQDSIAYGVTTAVAYATILNLHFVFNLPATPDSVALRVLANIAMNVGCSLILAYALSETLLAKASIFLMPATLVVVCFINGLFITLRSGISNAQVTLSGAFPRPLLSLAFSIALYVVLITIVLFIYVTIERRESLPSLGEDDE